MRTTREELRARVEEIRKVTKVDMTVEWAYGKPRVYRDNGGRELSPRLPTGQLMDWLTAWYDGWEMATRQSGV